MRRRSFIKGAGAATGAAVVGGGSAKLHGGPIGDARAILPVIGIAAAGAAVGYLAKTAADKYLGDERDYSGYTGADALKSEVAAGIQELESADERVLTSIQNNIENSKNIALSKAKAAIIEKMNAGKAESEAQTAMQNAIDEYYSIIQENLITHFNAQFNQVRHYYQQFKNHADITASDQFAFHDTQLSDNRGFFFDTMLAEPEDNDGSSDSRFVEYYTADLLAGTKEYVIGYPNDSGGQYYFAVSLSHVQDAYGSTTSASNSERNILYYTYDGTEYQFFDIDRYQTTWDNLITARDDVNSQLSGFVTDVYNNYAPGDIPTEDLVDPITAATELSQNYDGEQFRAASAGMLGIPTNAKLSADLTIHDPDGDQNVRASIFTNHQPTDGSGNNVPFQTGTTYSPSGWSDPLYISYTVDGEDTSDFTKIESDFTINSVTDSNGNDIQEFSPESKNTQTADVSTIQEELDQIRQYQLDLQETAQEETSGGGAGAGFFENTNQTTLLAIGGAALALVFGLGGSN